MNSNIVSQVDLDNFLKKVANPIRYEEYERPKEIDETISELVNFDSYLFYQESLNRLLEYVDSLETIIKTIAYVVQRPDEYIDWSEASRCL